MAVTGSGIDDLSRENDAAPERAGGAAARPDLARPDLARPDLAMALDAIYAYATDPENWEEMSSLLAHLDSNGDDEEMRTVIEGVRQHLARAEMLAERLHDTPDAEAPAPSYCHLVIGRDMRVLDVSDAAAAMLRPYCGTLETGARLSFADPENAARFRALAASIGKEGASEGPALLRLVAESGEEAVFGYVVAETQVPDALRRRLGLVQPARKGALVFVAPDRGAAADEAQIYRETFGLTPAEARLAARLKDGLSLKEAAAELNIAVNTARNQIKSVFEKLGVNRQSDLIRHLTELSQLAAFIQLDQPVADLDAGAPVSNPAAVPRRFVALPDGRRLCYREYGDPAGPAVLMLRSPLGSSLVASEDVEAAETRGLRLVVLERPGSGLSTPHPDLTHASFARDVELFVDAIGVGTFTLAANSSSVPLGLFAAAHLGTRVRRIVLMTSRFEAPMPRKGRPGMVNYFFSNLRRHPWLLDSTLFILRAKMSRPFMRSLVFHFFEKSPADFALIERDPALVESLIDQTMESIGETVQGLVQESHLLLRMAQPDFSGVTAPVHLLHGEEDGVIPLDEMKAQLARTNLKVEELRTFPGMGHLLLEQIRELYYDLLAR
ncbi:alpha/beta fold hydrolase [Parvibaculum sp.]|uniref:alpha/beta fold hydrolase n=1 Tax=Parvibaculum sp. TaxID=2024848 RepID=UPI001E0E50AE|nr:alpha/beta fold hydrolase [Parvibaculum sp.]MBX3489069.1 alpha/beta fold hydrolase [Parvibaculum sp.]MCW5727062.1 alpha/beta fold hydrolase [Parvibaculum sp.]